jgi:uncharacterized protein YkwD
LHPGRRLAVTAVVVCAIAAVPAPAEAAGPSTTLMRKINAFRGAHGRPPLRISGSLSQTARSYSQSMMRRDYFGHDRSIHASRRLFRGVGEALEFHDGHHARATLVLRHWARSPSHRALLLSRSFRWVGAGWTAGTFQGHDATIWVAQFGAR